MNINLIDSTIYYYLFFFWGGGGGGGGKGLITSSIVLIKLYTHLIDVTLAQRTGRTYIAKYIATPVSLWSVHYFVHKIITLLYKVIRAIIKMRVIGI